MAEIGFLFKSWFQFCNIVLLGNGSVSVFIGFSTGSGAEEKTTTKKENGTHSISCINDDIVITGSFSLFGVFLPTFLCDPGHRSMT